MTGECRHPLLARGGIESIAPAQVKGTLLHLGEYPGLILTGTGVVHGELVVFRDLDAVLDRLDEEEGVEYLRQRIALAGGHTAWAYVLREAPPRAKVIPSGDWRSR